MKLAVTMLAFLAALSTLAFAQESTSAVMAPTISSAAYVYVSSSLTTSKFEINAYRADSTGRLTPVIGSPFSADVQYMALNGNWLFGTNVTYIYSFRIESDGAVQQVSMINAAAHNPSPSGGPTSLFLDHTGATLYDGDTYAYGTESNAYQSFSIDQTTGQLNYLSITPDGGTTAGTVLSFTASDVFAYSSGCYHGSPEIFGYRRNSNQTLSPLNIHPSIPAAPSGEEFYCPYLAAADPTNHVAISLTPTQYYSSVGQPQLAVYSQTSTGNLTTTSTAANMPKTSVTQVDDLAMAPSGKLVAVGGTTGLQIFHFNGANPITHYTGLLTSKQIDQMFWDNANHLYAISRSAGKLYVFTVTPTGYSQAPGSPYIIVNPQNTGHEGSK